jgi:purine-binding chemotaxis protein CheW
MRGVKMEHKKSTVTGHKPQAMGKEGEIVQLIVFNLGDEEFGANINQVIEIINVGSITPIPDSPDFIKGVTNVRGEIAVIIDLKELFLFRTKKEVESKHTIITEQGKNLFGLMVDEVTEVLRIPETGIKPAPELITRIDRKYISGVVTSENRLIILLDLIKAFSEEGLAGLTEVPERHPSAEEEERPGTKADETSEIQIMQRATTESKEEEVL